MRFPFHAAAVLLACALSQAASAESPLQKSLRESIAKPIPEAAAKEVIVVLQLNPAQGATRAEGETHVEELVSFLRKQPGFIGGRFLRNINPSNSPQFLHVTRWKSFDDWEQLFANPAFSTELERQSPFISAEGSAFVQLE